MLLTQHICTILKVQSIHISMKCCIMYACYMFDEIIHVHDALCVELDLLALVWPLPGSRKTLENSSTVYVCAHRQCSAQVHVHVLASIR